MVELQLGSDGRPVVHPVAALFPMLTDDELRELADDIRTRGLLQSITLDAEGRILDGRNRYAACLIAGAVPSFVEFAGPDADGYALAVNIARRHLSAGARAIIREQARRLTGAIQICIADDDVSQPRLSEAGSVLDWAPDLVPNVVAGAHPLYKAVEEARRRKREAEALAVKMDQLRGAAPDLHAFVQDETLGVDEALAALRHRQDEERARLAREAEEERARASEEARLEHERSVVRQRDIESAVQAASNALSDIRSMVATILIGHQQGAVGLISQEQFEAMHATIDGLKEIL